MPPARRLWDSCIVIGYLAGYPDLRVQCEQIIGAARRGEVEIVVSALAMVETAYLTGQSDTDAEARIREFFGRDYVVPVQIDAPVASIARDLIRRHRNVRKIKPEDATHLATAMQWRIPIIETTDDDLLRFDKVEGSPLITVRHPLYEGGETRSLFDVR